MGISIQPVIVFALFTLMLALIRLLFYLKRKQNGQLLQFKKEIIINMFYIYLFMVVSLTLFPVEIINDPGYKVFYSPKINWIPVVETVKMVRTADYPHLGNYMIKFTIKNVLGNILLLMPLAFFLPVIYKKYRSLRNTLLTGMLVSLSIEAMQFIESFYGSHRTTDIDDFILNSAGVLIGYWIYNKFKNTNLLSIKDREAEGSN